MGTAPAHSRPKDRPKRGWRAWLIGGIAVAVVAGLAAGAGLFPRSPSNKASADPRPTVLPLNVVSTDPAPNATNVASDTTITIDLSTADTAQPFRNRPNVEIVENDMKVISHGRDWLEAWNNIWAP